MVALPWPGWVCAVAALAMRQQQFRIGVAEGAPWGNRPGAWRLEVLDLPAAVPVLLPWGYRPLRGHHAARLLGSRCSPLSAGSPHFLLNLRWYLEAS